MAFVSALGWQHIMCSISITLLLRNSCSWNRKFLHDYNYSFKLEVFTMDMKFMYYCHRLGGGGCDASGLPPPPRFVTKEGYLMLRNPFCNMYAWHLVRSSTETLLVDTNLSVHETPTVTYTEMYMCLAFLTYNHRVELLRFRLMR